jgi:hypothetical protein
MNSQKFNDEYQNFIIQNKISILNVCYDKQFLLQHIRKLSSSILNKWELIIERTIGKTSHFDTDFFELIIVYLESINLFINYKKQKTMLINDFEEEFNINDILYELHKQIISKQNKRSKILDKYFNYATSEFEFLLENGDFIPESGKKIPLKIDLTVFPEGFLSLLDKSDLRNLKIDEII